MNNSYIFYQCKIIMRNNFENIDIKTIKDNNHFKIPFEILNDGKIDIPNDSTIIQNNKDESIFEFKMIEIRQIIKVNQKIFFELEVNLKDKINLIPDLYELDIFLIKRNIGIISKKKVQIRLY